MRHPNDQRFCPHCGFELDACGACRDCDPDNEIEDDPHFPPPIHPLDPPPVPA